MYSLFKVFRWNSAGGEMLARFQKLLSSYCYEAVIAKQSDVKVIWWRCLTAADSSWSLHGVGHHGVGLCFRVSLDRMSQGLIHWFPLVVNNSLISDFSAQGSYSSSTWCFMASWLDFFVSLCGWCFWPLRIMFQNIMIESPVQVRRVITCLQKWYYSCVCTCCVCLFWRLSNIHFVLLVSM